MSPRSEFGDGEDVVSVEPASTPLSIRAEMLLWPDDGEPDERQDPTPYRPGLRLGSARCRPKKERWRKG